MNIEYKDFIGIFSDVFPEGYCEHVISEFERNREMGVGQHRQESENAPNHRKNDYQISANCKNLIFHGFGESENEKENANTLDIFYRGLQTCFDIYTEKFSNLKDVQLRGNVVKMQKTSSGGGYHIWHAEQGNGEQANRGLVYMLYLNTLPEEANGETEFLYQQRRINPVENTMLIWPAAFTHAHRGNPVYGDNSKYVVTGWFYHE